ncbi:thioredoxin family protein [Patescibacteria group bacterium AH-259-L05]|nr:thioredoxin family protein [Patescibacteria group bacterium AH-259-L05]
MSKVYKTLEQLLADDPLETLFQKLFAIYDNQARKEEKYKDTALAIETIFTDDETAKKLDGLDWRNEKDREKIEHILKVKVKDLQALSRSRTETEAKVKKAVNVTSLKKSWKMLLKNSPIEEIDINTFPPDSDRPFIVFYSTDWCMPCHITKPTLARLARFFTKAKLFYTSDRVLKHREDIEFVPWLAAYLPNGAKVSSECGGTTKELWDNMNLLISMGQSFEGKGTLVCSDDECKIEPKK